VIYLQIKKGKKRSKKAYTTKTNDGTKFFFCKEKDGVVLDKAGVLSFLAKNKKLPPRFCVIQPNKTLLVSLQI
jgi:hypothetical protein